ncbi:NUDIX hydrolase [Branchiibius sp. NY16-3462-2]|uniref:NUDIX hydrolase n=1 Tax=Branchiibius sp. NY16-3462-2 TaxID=1807500 RepID=UPI0025C15395|nr:NUDIX hydrolase [Branchiibius sp. NY16-3462-2]
MACVLVASTPEASWLPSGSTAEVWVGQDCPTPSPAIIVRLLLLRGETFFCVSSPKGLDLPTLFLGSGAERLTATEGLRQLLQRTLSQPDVAVRCVGYVRNVAPEPDADYPHPTPDAYVPVFAVDDAVKPVVPGEWIGVHANLNERHWWPIAVHAVR